MVKYFCMQKHRIFIAINFPEDVKKKLVGYQEKWPELQQNMARWPILRLETEGTPDRHITQLPFTPTRSYGGKAESSPGKYNTCKEEKNAFSSSVTRQSDWLIHSRIRVWKYSH